MLHRRRPTIVSISADPPSVRLSDRARRGAVVTRIHVRTSDGSPFRGTLRLSTTILRSEFLHMSTLVLSRALTPADDGTGTWEVVATTADGTFQATLSISYTIAPAAPAEGPPVFAPPSAAVSLADDSAAGTSVWSGTLTNSDGSAFNGTVSVGTAPLTFTA